MINNILVVCIGNICRSPMAEGLLKAKLQKHRPNIQISSAGISALVDHPASKTSQVLLSERGLDISAHRARQITPEILFPADLVLTMSLDQQRWIEQHYPNARGRVFRLGHKEGFDVVDPYRRMRIIFEQSLAQIEQGLDSWYDMLIPKDI